PRHPPSVPTRRSSDLGHALGWFVAMSGTGSPPPYTKSGEVYMDIFPGLFAVRNNKLGNYIQPIGFSRTLLLQQMALFAEQVKLRSEARRVGNECLSPG